MFCRNCGKELNDEHKFCASCGAVNKVEEIPSSSIPVAPVEAEITAISSTTDKQEPDQLHIESLPKESDSVVEDSVKVSSIASSIESLNVSEKWKVKFRLIEKAGGRIGYGCPNISVLTPKERKEIGFNFWGFFFASMFYFVKGMWAKGLILLTVSIVLGLIFPPIAAVVWCWCGMAANGDYYRLKVLNRQF